MDVARFRTDLAFVGGASTSGIPVRKSGFRTARLLTRGALGIVLYG